ncbi:MAG: hypothetical protein LBU32_29085 [Clostridiales bacterium]|jgi:hypothetical protein|nr:hypothetical protein [Clostridiales bacterium]
MNRLSRATVPPQDAGLADYGIVHRRLRIFGGQPFKLGWTKRTCRIKNSSSNAFWDLKFVDADANMTIFSQMYRFWSLIALSSGEKLISIALAIPIFIKCYLFC